MRKKPLVVAAILAVTAVLGGGAVAFGELPFSSDGNTILACYSNGGALKLRTTSEPNCPKGYAEIEWNVTGPQGGEGPQGPQGPSGTSQVYFAQNSHVVESEDTPQEIVALADLPAGNYVFTTQIYNDVYQTENSVHFEALDCHIKSNGVDVGLPNAEGGSIIVGDGIGDLHSRYYTDVVALNVPAGSDFRVSCVTFAGDDASLGVGRITALKVTAIN